MMDNPPLRRQFSLRSSFVGVALRYFCFYHLIVFSVIWTAIAAASNVSSSSSHHDHQRDLSSIPGTTACANCSPEKCVATTVSDTACNPCANGQLWWPCNLPGECYCEDPSAATAKEKPKKQGTGFASDDCSTAACTSEGGKCVTASPNVNDQQCSDCEDGKQSWWPCNVMGACVCELPAPPTESPTTSQAPSSPSAARSASEEPTTPIPTIPKQPTLTPTVAAKKFIPSTQMLEGMLVLNAHITANKILLARELLLSPSMNGANPNTFSFMGFKESLQQMIMTPIVVEGKDSKTMEDIQVPLLFYIGDTTTTSSKSNNERVYGLVNVALFLASAYSDSLSNGSCDEINSDIVDGFLPMSNACGQRGMSYQNSTAKSETDVRQANSSPLFCAQGDQKYACDVDIKMRARAKPPSMISSRSGGNASPPGPFYCGPKIDYHGLTGHWDFKENKEIFQSAKKNRLGRTDVQGCCFWGRGSVPIKGTCAYGKLNYYLGKRAADEGRPAMFPDIDFCKNPGAICDDEHPNLKWIVGFFRWITEIQEYDSGKFNYMKRLRKFVDDGFKDFTFIDSVSGIVSQQCDTPPCIEGIQFLREQKRADFVKILKLLGFNVPQNEESM